MISNVIAKNIYYYSNANANYKSMSALIKSLDVFETDELKIKELCKVEGVGKEKASHIVKYLFGNDNDNND